VSCSLTNYQSYCVRPSHSSNCISVVHIHANCSLISYTTRTDQRNIQPPMYNAVSPLHMIKYEDLLAAQCPPRLHTSRSLHQGRMISFHMVFTLEHLQHLIRMLRSHRLCDYFYVHLVDMRLQPGTLMINILSNINTSISSLATSIYIKNNEPLLRLHYQLLIL
jgi:hypothetical protein